MQSTGSGEFLIVSMAYCMTWELTGTRAKYHWSKIHALLAGENGLSERQRWAIELYEEGAPTAQEERSIRSRIDAYLLQPRDVAYFRCGILNLLPDQLRRGAEAHSLMHGLVLPSTEFGLLKSWVMSWKSPRVQAAQARVLPLAEREADFGHFLEQPHFVVSFRKFWRVAPKCRSNRRTRVLVCIGAALSQMVRVDETVDFDLWTDRLAVTCHFTEQTRVDLRLLIDEMSNVSYDLQELAYRLFVDAREIDQRNLQSFMNHYGDELSALAPELARSMQFNSNVMTY
ncbi:MULTISPECIES: hypothetical protein [unclassified Lentimonas]|uniref:hypothetical protein n=1 Tax=unclassified Lentimonas TaxID=2630993 RepID=UPI00138A15AA|nr:MULTISPECIES: hypothetical protein [unclassified Lentimonas]